jgi:hypothetical protein
MQHQQQQQQTITELKRNAIAAATMLAAVMVGALLFVTLFGGH